MEQQSFPLYGAGNSYITPYSSVVDGGELVTEFNLRAPLNIIGWKTIDLSDIEDKPDMPGSWTYTSWLTGTRTPSCFELSLPELTVNQGPGPSLEIAAGEGVLCGYFIDLDSVSINTAQITTSEEFPQNSADSEVVTKFVKLQLNFTESMNNRHDERLVPPIGPAYLGIEVVFDDELPTEQQLLLGTISRDINGLFSVWNNPRKARVLSIDSLAGAENYGDLIEAPNNDGIYGIQHNDGNNLVNIEEWLWLGYTSTLGRYLRNLARNPDDAGIAGSAPYVGTNGNWYFGATDTGVYEDEGVPEIGSSSSPFVVPTGKIGNWYIVKYSEPDEEGTSSVLSAIDTGVRADGSMLKLIVGRADSSINMLSLSNTKAPEINYRVLKDGNQKPDCYAEEKLILPIVDYDNHVKPDDIPFSLPTNPKTGLLEGYSLYMIDELWRERATYHNGRQFGPFATVDDATNFVDSFNGEFLLNDYYWVLSDTIKTGSADDDALQVSYGEFTGNYSAITTGQIKADVKGTTRGAVTGTARSEDESEFAVSGEVQGDVTGEATGSAKGTGTGSLKGTLDSFNQNVSARWVYMLADPTDPDSEKVWKQQMVLRGFAVPATPQFFGFVKPSENSNANSVTPGNVIVDPTTQQLRVDDLTRMMIDLSGWKTHAGGLISLNSTMHDKIQNLEGTWFVNPVTINLVGDGWDAESLPALNRMKGDITLDISQAAEINPGGTVTPLINCVEINTLTLIGGSSGATVNVENCTIGIQDFNSIHRWVSSRFTSGSNTAQVVNPWMTIPQAFSQNFENSVQARFVSVTRGEYEIESAELDIWIKRAPETKKSNTGRPKISNSIPDMISASQEDTSLLLRSIEQLKFPPFLFKTDEEGNVLDYPRRQDIPDNLNLKISGTAGTHRVYDDLTSSYIISGNWVSTIDWTHKDFLTLNARILNSSGDPRHSFADVRFRALVQFTHVDDMIESSTTYDNIYF